LEEQDLPGQIVTVHGMDQQDVVEEREMETEVVEEMVVVVEMAEEAELVELAE